MATKADPWPDIRWLISRLFWLMAHSMSQIRQRWLSISLVPWRTGQLAKLQVGSPRTRYGRGNYVPEEHLGDVIGHVNAKRGEVNQMEARGVNHVVKGMCRSRPCLGMPLTSVSDSGRNYSMQFAHYAPVSAETRRSIVGN